MRLTLVTFLLTLVFCNSFSQIDTILSPKLILDHSWDYNYSPLITADTIWNLSEPITFQTKYVGVSLKKPVYFMGAEIDSMYLRENRNGFHLISSERSKVNFQGFILPLNFKYDPTQINSFILGEYKDTQNAYVLEWRNIALCHDDTFPPVQINYQVWFYDNHEISVKIGPHNFNYQANYKPCSSASSISFGTITGFGWHVENGGSQNVAAGFKGDPVNPSFIYNQNGTYGFYTCPPIFKEYKFVSNIDTTYIDRTGIEDLDLNKVNLFPNPCSDYLNIEVSKWNKSSTVMICNSLGEIIISQGIEQDKTQLPVNDLSPGIYFCTIKTDNTISTKKFIISK